MLNSSATATKLLAVAHTFWRKQGACLSPKHVLLMVSFALLVQVSPFWLPTRDGAGYLSIAKSLKSGDGLLRFGNPQLYFGPGYSVLISPAFLYSDQPFLVISLLHWLLLITFICGAFFWLKRQLPDHVLLLTGLCAANVGVLYYFRRTLSEAAFMPVLMWTAVVMDETINATDESRGPKYAALSAVMIAYLCTVRLAGVTLACGFGLLILYKVIKKEIPTVRAALYSGAVVGTALTATLLVISYDRAMALVNNHAPTYTDHITGFHSKFYEQLLFGLRLRIQEIGRLLVPGAFKAYGGWLEPIMIIYIPIFIAVAIGWFQMLSRRPSVLLLAFPFYLSLYVIWPYDQGARFMTPMVPVLWLSLIGATFFSKWRPYISRFSVVLILASLITSVVYLIADRLEARKVAPYWALTETISKIAPKAAQIGVIRTSSSFSASSFEAICSLKRNRRCEEIRDDKDQRILQGFDYIVLLGPALIKPGFAPVLSTHAMTVLKRLQPMGNHHTETEP